MIADDWRFVSYPFFKLSLSLFNFVFVNELMCGFNLAQGIL